MSEEKKPTTISDIIERGRNSNTYDSLHPKDRITYLTIYVDKNKQLNLNQHEAVLGMTDEEFFKKGLGTGYDLDSEET
ncbi:MAG: hypothetical protein Tp1100SUR639781_54 [Prokaryotic dsDNA virus sp.]|nr:MAG: hypothetical protein Tp1100SUR639781_54 [Prokaryotic dsDNA virus sp.]|tara:strand:+ start:13064 stop:13297 length:234 start_codon:yes stop_codon:yes gene_type:complete